MRNTCQTKIFTCCLLFIPLFAYGLPEFASAQSTNNDVPPIRTFSKDREASSGRVATEMKFNDLRAERDQFAIQPKVDPIDERTIPKVPPFRPKSPAQNSILERLGDSPSNNPPIVNAESFQSNMPKVDAEAFQSTQPRFDSLVVPASATLPQEDTPIQGNAAAKPEGQGLAPMTFKSSPQQGSLQPKVQNFQSPTAGSQDVGNAAINLNTTPNPNRNRNQIGAQRNNASAQPGVQNFQQGAANQAGGIQPMNNNAAKFGQNRSQNGAAMNGAAMNSGNQAAVGNPVVQPAAPRQNLAQRNPVQPMVPDLELAKNLIQSYAIDSAPQPLPGMPTTIEVMLQQTNPRYRNEMVQRYWATYRAWCKLNCCGKVLAVLNQLGNPVGQADQQLLRTARSIAENELLAAEIDFESSQSKLQNFVPGGQNQLTLPLPSDLPLVTSYNTHYDYYSSRRQFSSEIRQIATGLSKMYNLINQSAKTARSSENSMNQMIQMARSGQSTMSNAIESVRMWNDANMQFVDTVVNYNDSIATYSLTVMGSGEAPDKLAIALIGKPKSNTIDNGLGQPTERQATLPQVYSSTQQGMPSFTARPPAQGTIQSDGGALPGGYYSNQGSSGFKTGPTESGTSPSFGNGFGGGFRN